MSPGIHYECRLTAKGLRLNVGLRRVQESEITDFKRQMTNPEIYLATFMPYI